MTAEDRRGNTNLRPIDVAFAGDAHVHVRDYLDACRSLAGVRIVGACLVERESPVVFPTGVPILDTQAELPPHDLCIVTTDIASHERVAKDLVASAVYIEKPLGTDVAAAQRVATLLTRARRSVQLGYFLRRDRALAMLRARLLARRLGRLHSIELTYEHDGLSRGWLADWPAHSDPQRMGNGAFGDLAAHLVDFCHATVGPLRPIRCALTRKPGSTFDVGGNALLRTVENARVHLRAGADARRVRLELRFVGDAGELVLRDGVLTETLAGLRRTLVHGVEPSPRAGLSAAIRAFRGSAGGVGAHGATLGEAIEVDRTLEALRALATR